MDTWTGLKWENIMSKQEVYFNEIESQMGSFLMNIGQDIELQIIWNKQMSKN